MPEYVRLGVRWERQTGSNEGASSTPLGPRHVGEEADDEAQQDVDGLEQDAQHGLGACERTTV